MAQPNGLDSFMSEIFSNSFAASSNRGGSFMDKWRGSDNVVRRIGRESTAALSKYGTELSGTREDSDMSDLNSYFQDLDGVESELKQVADILSPGTGDPVKDRATLRAARSKGIKQRMNARAKLQSQKLGKVDESASYIDPISGERVQIDASSEDTTSVNRMGIDSVMKMTGEFYDKAIQDFYQANRYDIDNQGGYLTSDRSTTRSGRYRYDPDITTSTPLTREMYEEDLAAGKTVSYQARRSNSLLTNGNPMANNLETIEGRTLQYIMGADKIDSDLQSRDGNATTGERVAVGQAKLSFQQLASSALQARMQSLGSELTLRQQAAQGELDSRRKANANISELEKKRVQQVSKITSSINDINSMFALQDSKFLAAENQQANDGVDFRSDRPQ